MSAAMRVNRFRAYLEFVAAVLYFFVARSFAHNVAAAFFSSSWFPLVEQLLFALFLIFGYAFLGAWLDREPCAIASQGLPLREGFSREAATGLAVGWGIAVVCVLPLALIGGIAIVLTTQPSTWAWLLADTAFFALAALAEEVAFRGYGFQRFEFVVGPWGASLGFACFYAVVQALQPGTGRVTVAVSLVFGLLLSMAYLRTRALWFSWGINFGWKASRALLFGLSVNGVTSHSSVIEGDPMGPFWLTGGGFGLDATWLAFLLMLCAFPLVYRLTRDLDFRWNAPIIVPGGLPVDLEAAARRQHEAAMSSSPEPARPSLVQIAPAASDSAPSSHSNSQN